MEQWKDNEIVLYFTDFFYKIIKNTDFFNMEQLIPASDIMSPIHS